MAETAKFLDGIRKVHEPGRKASNAPKISFRPQNKIGRGRPKVQYSAKVLKYDTKTQQKRLDGKARPRHQYIYCSFHT